MKRVRLSVCGKESNETIAYSCHKEDCCGLGMVGVHDTIFTRSFPNHTNKSEHRFYG